MLGKKEEKKEEQAKEEVKAAPSQSKKNPLDEKKIEKDDTNEGTFMVGDEVKIKDLDFVAHKVGGLELVLKRKDFK